MSKIGLLSDSHGRSEITHQAVDVLVAHEAEVLIHLGDIGTVQVLDPLAVCAANGTAIEARVVFGNCDWNQAPLAQYAHHIGVQVDHPCGRLPLEEGELAFCHGHEPAPMKRAMAKQVRYLCHGHTHCAIDWHNGLTRVINPGALFRASKRSVALLDTLTDRLQFFDCG